MRNAQKHKITIAGLHTGRRRLGSLRFRANGDRAWLVQRLVDLGFVHFELVQPNGVVHQDRDGRGFEWPAREPISRPDHGAKIWRLYRTFRCASGLRPGAQSNQIHSGCESDVRAIIPPLPSAP